jgi:hypothetical protein
LGLPYYLLDPVLGGVELKSHNAGALALLTLALITAVTCIAYADTGVKAVPEIQGLATITASNVVGTVTETDSGVWSLTNDPTTYYVFTWAPDFGVIFFPDQIQQLIAAGGSIGPNSLSIPSNLLDQQVVGTPSGYTWADLMANVASGPVTETIQSGGLHTGVLDPGQVQYTAGYNDQYVGVSGQQTFAKSMALSTANKIADQSNIKANTNIQFIALDTGRATRSEDLFLDGAAQAQDSSSLILCPFANANPGIIPAFCNIEQAGSAFDTTLTSTVTSADTRFIGTEATIPVVLNYNINAQGITLSDGTSSPMIGSVSAYLKVHTQEARNESVISGGLLNPFSGQTLYSFPDTINPQKSEDLVYSETSTASGLISKFSKSMSYSSQASAVQAPISVIPVGAAG